MRDDIRRSVSCILTDTDEDNKKETNIILESDDDCGLSDLLKPTVVSMWQMPCSGEIAIQIEGEMKERDFDDLTTDWQRQILDGLLEDDDIHYQPCTLMEKDKDGNETPIVVVGLHQMKGGAYFQIDDALREHLGEELIAYEKKAAKDGLTCDGNFYLLTKNLAMGRKSEFLGRQYWFEYTDEQMEEMAIDTIVELTDEQMELVGQMQELYLRMQEAHIAFAMNDDGEVVAYNAEHIKDCESCGLYDVPGGYEVADIEIMEPLFPVWTGERLCLQRLCLQRK